MPKLAISHRSLLITSARRFFSTRAITQQQFDLPRSFSSSATKDVTKSLTTGVTDISPATIKDGSKVLFFAAQEADRLSTNIGFRRRNHETTTTQEEDSLTTEENISSALESASALLIVSRPSNALADAILRRTSESQVASLHRAFVSITSWCLDVVPYEKTSAIILDRALAVSRRAYDLSFPFHLPLYQRLAEQVAAHGTEEAHAAETILEIASWVKTSLDNVYVSNVFFETALKTLVQRHQFCAAADLLAGIREIHGIYFLDMSITTDILLQLRDFTKDCLLSDPTAATTKSLPAEKELAQIVRLLQPSILHFLQQQRDAVMATLDEQMDQLLDDMEEFHAFLRSKQRDRGRASKAAAASANDNDEGSGSEGKVDPIDQAVESILTRELSDNYAKGLVSDLFKHSKLQEHDKVRLGGVQMLGAYNDESGAVHTFRIDKESNQNESDSDSDDDYDLHYARGKDDLYQFPDVVAQVVKLNHGRGLRFTRAYEDMLWKRGYEDDDGANSDSSVAPETDTDSDDDDDDYF